MIIRLTLIGFHGVGEVGNGDCGRNFSLPSTRRDNVSMNWKNVNMTNKKTRAKRPCKNLLAPPTPETAELQLGIIRVSGQMILR